MRPQEVAADLHSSLVQGMELDQVSKGPAGVQDIGPAEVQDMAPDFGQGMVLVGLAEMGQRCNGEELHWETYSRSRMTVHKLLVLF